MEKTTLAIDGHVHLYSMFDLAEAVKNGTNNLLKNAEKRSKHKNPVIPVWLLVERSDTNYFEELGNNPEKFSSDGLTFVKHDKLTIKVEKGGEIILLIFAGRQLVSKENLEVLSLVSDWNVPDKEKPMKDLIKAVKENGGIATVNWAPGKWFFQRGKIIASLIAESIRDDFFIGETTLRNTLWPKPKLIKQAEKKGFRVICGSDPLPFKGEEGGIGSFGFLVDGEFDCEKPADSMRKILNDSQKPITLIGKRNNVFTFARRQIKIMAEKKAREKVSGK